MITANVGRKLSTNLPQVTSIQIRELSTTGMKFFRFRILVDTDLPLRRFIRITSNGKSNEFLTGVIQYKKLPHMCFNCGYFNHTISSCQAMTKELTMEQWRTLPYDKWLKMERRSILVEEVKLEMEEHPNQLLLEPPALEDTVRINVDIKTTEITGAKSVEMDVGVNHDRVLMTAELLEDENYPIQRNEEITGDMLTEIPNIMEIDKNIQSYMRLINENINAEGGNLGLQGGVKKDSNKWKRKKLDNKSTPLMDISNVEKIVTTATAKRKLTDDPVTRVNKKEKMNVSTVMAAAAMQPCQEK